jgi:hypothetical protein
MSKPVLTLFAALCCALGAKAATSTDSLGVTTSDDADKAAAVERHADELRAQQHGMGMHVGASGTQAQHGAKHTRHRHHRAAAAGAKAASAP